MSSVFSLSRALLALVGACQCFEQLSQASQLNDGLRDFNPNTHGSARDYASQKDATPEPLFTIPSCLPVNYYCEWAAFRMSQQHDYASGLQVDNYSTLEHYSKNDLSSSAPEPVFKPYNERQPGYDYSDLEYNSRKDLSSTAPETYSGQHDGPASGKRLIWGFAAKTFWILVGVIVILVIAAAVGGGVGGSLASRKSTTSAAADSSSTTAASGESTQSTSGSSTSHSATSSTSPSSISQQTSQSGSSSSTTPIKPSTTSGSALTTTEVVGPSATLLRDCPSSNNTVFTTNNGQSMSWQKICGLSYPNLSQDDSVNQKTTSLDDCIVLCAEYNTQNQADIENGVATVCNAVCWRNGFVNDGFPGQCFGYSAQKSGTTFSVQTEAICDSAAWVDQSFG